MHDSRAYHQQVSFANAVLSEIMCIIARSKSGPCKLPEPAMSLMELLTFLQHWATLRVLHLPSLDLADPREPQDSPPDVLKDGEDTILTAAEEEEADDNGVVKTRSWRSRRSMTVVVSAAEVLLVLLSSSSSPQGISTFIPDFLLLAESFKLSTTD